MRFIDMKKESENIDEDRERVFDIVNGNGFVDSEIEAKKKEARYLQDKATLETIKNPYDCNNATLHIANVLKENYIRWLDEKGYKKEIINLDDIRNEITSLFFKKKYSEATEVIVKYIEKTNYIYTTKDDKASEVWIYSDGIYVPNGRSEIKEIMRELLLEYFSMSAYKAVLNKIEADTFIEPKKFFNQNYVYEVPVENGILNVLTRQIRPFNPDEIFFVKLPVRFNPFAECKKIDKFLQDVLANPDDRLVYYEIAGFGLINEYVFEKAFMMVGEGRNGKGKSIELLKRLVGPDNCVSLALSSLTQDNFSISNLFGKKFNLAGDLSSTDLKETGIFKSLTGRDIISAKRKFLSDITFINSAKFVFACNQLPRVYDPSTGFWERWVLLEFPYKFVEKEFYDVADAETKKTLKLRDEKIIEKISTDDEMSGFLNKAIDGLARLMENKKFSYTKGTEEIKNTWIRKSDSFMAFCMDCVEEDTYGKVSKAKIRKEYANYCKLHKIRGLSDKSIKATLQEMFGVGEEYFGEFNNQQWCWVGIKLNQEKKK
jgi:putative DNA primase/helicase